MFVCVFNLFWLIHNFFRFISCRILVKSLTSLIHRNTTLPKSTPSPRYWRRRTNERVKNTLTPTVAASWRGHYFDLYFILYNVFFPLLFVLPSWRSPRMTLKKWEFAPNWSTVSRRHCGRSHIRSSSVSSSWTDCRRCWAPSARWMSLRPIAAFIMHISDASKHSWIIQYVAIGRPESALDSFISRSRLCLLILRFYLPCFLS